MFNTGWKDRSLGVSMRFADRGLEQLWLEPIL